MDSDLIVTMAEFIYQPVNTQWRRKAHGMLIDWINKGNFSVDGAGFDIRDDMPLIEVPERNGGVPLGNSPSRWKFFNPSGNGACMFR